MRPSSRPCSGVGKRLAARIVLELREKVAAAGAARRAGGGGESEVVAALEALGYTSREGREAARAAVAGLDAGASLEDRVKEALRSPAPGLRLRRGLGRRPQSNVCSIRALRPARLDADGGRARLVTAGAGPARREQRRDRRSGRATSTSTSARTQVKENLAILLAAARRTSRGG